MTLGKWITFASAAAMLASVGACKDTGGGSSATKTSPEGRRSDTLPRARDAGSDMTTGSGTSATPTSPTTPPSPSTTPPSSTTPSSSGSSSDTKR